MEQNEVFYPPTIEDQPIADLIEGSGQDTSGRSYETEVYKPLTEVDKNFPSTMVARETVSQSLNTRTKKILSEYTFGKSGAIKIGEYEFGVSGEIAFTPNGIAAKNLNGEQTFALDATTGDATFKGTVAAGAIIANGKVFITENGILVNDGTYDRILIGEW